MSSAAYWRAIALAIPGNCKKYIVAIDEASMGSRAALERRKVAW
jgi:hypothetical protein